MSAKLVLLVHYQGLCLLCRAQSPPQLTDSSDQASGVGRGFAAVVELNLDAWFFLGGGGRVFTCQSYDPS